MILLLFSRYSLEQTLNVHTLGNKMEKTYEEESKKGKEVKRLMSSVAKIVWKNYLLAGLYLLYTIIVGMIIPIITSYLIIYLTSKDTNKWHGLRYILAFVGIGITSSISGKKKKQLKFN